MSVLYPPTNEDEIFRHCRHECGIITATEDKQHFAIGCSSCKEKFLYFDSFIEHMQTKHSIGWKDFDRANPTPTSLKSANDIVNKLKRKHEDMHPENLTDTDPSYLEPETIMIKEEKIDHDDGGDDPCIQNEPLWPDDDDYKDDWNYNSKHGQPEVSMEVGDTSYLGDSYGSYNDEYAADDDQAELSNDGEQNYDDLVEESLFDNPGSIGVVSHIKDRKMIQFVIDAYRRNTFLWDHRHPQFRDRVRRSQFIEWINSEFKKRFNMILAKDAVTRKWDNLRTVYKRECNRMALEKTNISTLWYFKELHFLNRLYGGNQKVSEAIIKETIYRRRYSALWNDISTNKLLQLLKTYPCFYDKYNIDYRSKEKRGEALVKIATELSQLLEVTTVQISKRISQLRFDYSKQKQERLTAEMAGRPFAPSYSYYGQMLFMDADIAPFKCEHCALIINTPRDMDTHMLTHNPDGLPMYTYDSSFYDSNSASASGNGNGSSAGAGGGSNYYCPVCQLGFNELEQYNLHKQIHPSIKEKKKFHCDLCTASFREKSNFDEHMRRHNDELLLPDLNTLTPAVDSAITNNGDPYSTYDDAQDFRPTAGVRQSPVAVADSSFKCDFPNCGKTFNARNSMIEHVKSHYSDEEYGCDVCGKVFRSVKNLHNHKKIHDTVKKYVCKICGSAFAQAAGLYLHKRRHNKENADRARQNC